MNPQDFQNHQAGKAILTPTGFWAYVPNPLPPELSWSMSLISTLSEAERDLSKLAAFVSGFPFPRLLIEPFIRNEAVISSRIEGTRTSLPELLNYEIAQLPLFDKSGDVREVYNYVQAMDYGMDRLQSLPVSLRLIREIHARLIKDVRGGNLTPGEFRRSQNWIGPVGSTPATAPYVPPPVEDMHLALDSLEKFLHVDSQIPPLVRIGLIHYQFEAIHPFLDGNGRVGRLLIMILLCAWNLLPQPVLNLSTYIERYRQVYYDLLLGVSQRGDWENWLHFFLKGISQQARDGLFRMEKLQEIRISYQPIVEADRNVVRMSKMVDFLFSRPILSIKQVAEGLDMPVKTAAAYLSKLEKARIVRETTGFVRNRIYQADEILRIIQTSEAPHR